MDTQKPTQGLMGSAVRARPPAQRPSSGWDARRWKQVALIVYLAWVPLALVFVFTGHDATTAFTSYGGIVDVPASPLYSAGIWMLVIAVVGLVVMLALAAIVKSAVMVKRVK